MMNPSPDPIYFSDIPLLGILATLDIALETLLGALREQHPNFESQEPTTKPWEEEHRYVHATASLAKALQAMIAELYLKELDHIDIPHDLF